MSNPASERSGLEIISEMLSITRLMASKSDDADFLLDSVDKRGALMEEYDRVKASSPSAKAAIEKSKPEIDRMIRDIRELDKQINLALSSLRDEAKLGLRDANSQKKVLNYTNNMIQRSGSYMDIHK